MKMLQLLYLILAAAVSFIIAANNSANSVGPLYGSGISSYFKAAIYSGIFVMMGTLLEGYKMSGAVTGGVVAEPFSLSMSLIVLLSTFILMLLFTFLSVPLSASQIMIGSVTAVAFAYELHLNSKFLSLIFVSWVLTFVFGLIAALFVYLLLIYLTPRLRLFSLSRFYTLSLYIGSAFLAYTLGANTIGLIVSLNLSVYSMVIGGCAALLGTYLLGRRTVKTAGKKIISLDPPRAFAAQISAALVVETFTQLHLPVSITQAIIGGIIGTGLVKGYREINRKTLKNLGISWTMAPLLSFLLTLTIIMVSSWLL